MGGVWEGEIITKNSIIPSQSTLVTKSIFKFSYLEILLADPLCAAYSGTPLKKDPYFHLPPMSKCHPVWKGEECIFLLSITCLSGSRHPEASWVGSEQQGEPELGQGTQPARQAGGQAACHMILLEKSHWNQNLGQRQTEREITPKNVTREKKREKGRIKYVL